MPILVERELTHYEKRPVGSDWVDIDSAFAECAVMLLKREL